MSSQVFQCSSAFCLALGAENQALLWEGTEAPKEYTSLSLLYTKALTDGKEIYVDINGGDVADKSMCPIVRCTLLLMTEVLDFQHSNLNTTDKDLSVFKAPIPGINSLIVSDILLHPRRVCVCVCV